MSACIVGCVAPTSTLPNLDAATGGLLIPYLTGQLATGATFRAVAKTVEARFGIAVSAETIARWAGDLAALTPDGAA